jgi:excisionase family DNA binding protein
MGDFNRPFYTVPEAAELLRVHENTIYSLVRSKKIEHYKIGKQIRIAAAELERLKVPVEPTESASN